MYTYSKIKRKTLPNQKQFEDVQELADRDNAQDRDVRPLMSVLMRLKRADPRLRGHILTRSTAVSSFSWNIIPANPKPTPAETELALKVRQRCANLINEVIAHRLQASLYDVMVIESEINRLTPLGAVQTPVRRYRPVELEKTTDYEASIFRPTEEKFIDKVLPLAIGSPLDDRARFTVAISDDDERGGLFRTIALHEILLWDNRLEWGNFNKKLKGIIQAIYMEGATNEEIRDAADATKQIAQNAYSVTSDMIEFKFNQLTQAGGWTSFKDFLHDVKTDITLTLLGQANTAELPSGGGSRAALQVLNLIRSDIMFDDMIRTEKCINSQVLLNDFRLNHSEGATEADYKFAFNMPDGLDPETRARITIDAYTSGMELLTAEAYREIGMTPPPGLGDTIQLQSSMP